MLKPTTTTFWDRVWLTLGMLLVIVGCASAPAPTDKLALAKTAIDRAEGARAVEFAAVELNEARSKYSEAEKLADKESTYIDASRLAEKAEIEARLAEAKARTSVFEKLAQESDKTLETLRSEAEKQE
jgi:hypothetical protein